MAQTAHAEFQRGLQESIPYTPGSAVDGGDFVFFGSGLERLVGVALAPIAANVTDNVCIAGQFRVKKKAAATFAVGDLVGWDTGAEEAVVSGDGALDVQLGVCVELAEADDDCVVTKINAAAGWEASA
ncbi:MAG: capsid cement protein [Pirellulales bacterium]